MAKRVAICSDIKHIEHGEGSKPDFMMRVVNYYRSALSRQVGEAMRIGRIGERAISFNIVICAPTNPQLQFIHQIKSMDLNSK